MHKYSFILSVCVFLGGTQALAQEADPKALFVRGNSAFNGGDFDEAADFFRQAYSAKPTWKLQYNIGQAEAAAKRYGLALGAFEAYLAEGGDEIDNERNNTVLSEITRLRILVGNLEIQAPEGAVMTIDGRDRGSAPFPSVVRVAVGERNIVIRHNGQTIYEKTLEIVGGVSVTITAEAAPSESTVPTEPGDDEGPEVPVREKSGRTGSPLTTAGWVAAGVGAAALIVGGVLGGMAVSGQKDLDSKCVDQLCPMDAVNQDDLDRVATNANLSTAFIIGGGIVATAGALMVIVGMNRKETAVSLSPVMASGFGGLTLEGRF